MHPRDRMTTIALPQISLKIESSVGTAAREGLSSRKKRLPPWLFYDRDGSLLFDQITQLPEYYLTRTEREILSAHAGELPSWARAPRTKRVFRSKPPSTAREPCITSRSMSPPAPWMRPANAL